MNVATKPRARSNGQRRPPSFRPQLERLEGRLQPSSFLTVGLDDPLLTPGLLDENGDSPLSDNLSDAGWESGHQRSHASIPPETAGAPRGVGSFSGTAPVSASTDTGSHEARPLLGPPPVNDLLALQTAGHALGALGAGRSVAAPSPVSEQGVSTTPVPVTPLTGALRLVPGPSGPAGGPTPALAWASYRGFAGHPYDIEWSAKIRPSTGELVVGGNTTEPAVPSYGTTTTFHLDGSPYPDGSAYHTSFLMAPGSDGLSISGIDVDGPGNIYVCFSTKGFGMGGYTGVAKLDPTAGTVVWSVGLGLPGSSLNGIYVKEVSPGAGYLYATGGFNDMPFGGHPNDIMAAKIAFAPAGTPGDGSVLWAVHHKFADPSEGRGVVVNDAGVMLAGTIYATPTKPQVLLTMLKDDDGAYDHGWTYPSELGDAYSVTKDAAGFLYFTGRYFDPSLGMGYNSLLLVKWDPSLSSSPWGWFYTSTAIDASYNAEAIALAIKAGPTGTDTIYVAGFCDNDDPLGHATNALVVKFKASTGALFSPDSHLAYGGAVSGSAATYDINEGLDVDGSGTAYAVGTTHSVDFPATNGTTYSGGGLDGQDAQIVGL